MADEPPLDAAKDKADKTRHHIPWQHHRMARGKEVFREMLQVVSDKIDTGTGREEKRQVKAIIRSVGKKPAPPERKHEERD